MSESEYAVFLKQRGTGARNITQAPAALRTSPTSRTEPPEAALLAQIQALAKQHGWAGCHTYNPDGPDKGLHCILVRDVVIFAEVCERLTASQQAWLEALRQTGQVEVYWWHPEDQDQIKMRLTKKAIYERSTL